MPPEFLCAADVHSFLSGKTLYSIDPATGDCVATVRYNENGSCHVEFADGTKDTGQYGFEGQQYWTRYKIFRSGERHFFYLEKISGHAVLAYHTNGDKAYIQSRQKP